MPPWKNPARHGVNMTPLFKLGERKPTPAWVLKECAVLSGAIEAQEEVERAKTPDEKRLAEQKLTRFIFTADRLKAERRHREALIRMLAA